jgi:hypothetical protein
MGSLHVDFMTDAGIVVESPPGQSAGISPIRREHTDALAEAVSGEGYRLSGVPGDAFTTSALLYAQLGNASSNAVYRRLGFEAVSEVLVYRFDDGVAGR